MKKLFYLLPIMVLVVAGCDLNNTKTEQITTTQNSQQTPVGSNNTSTNTTTYNNGVVVKNTFTSTNLKAGDKVGAMAVVSVNAFNKAHDLGVPAWELSDTNVEVVFSGNVSLTGDYSYTPKGDGVISDIYCFYNLDSESQKKLPRLEGETRDPWFCFSNKEKARELLGTGNGRATITISEYILVSYPSEVWDTAVLYSIEKK